MRIAARDPHTAIDPTLFLAPGSTPPRSTTMGYLVVRVADAAHGDTPSATPVPLGSGFRPFCALRNGVSHLYRIPEGVPPGDYLLALHRGDHLCTVPVSLSA